MNWDVCFRDKLVEWVNLREYNNEPFGQYLEKINSWWHHNQWVPYELHWDDRDEWPTPWELLNKTRFCTVSRGLGILYTLALSNCDLIKSATMHDCSASCPVVVNNSIVLNLDSHQTFEMLQNQYVGYRQINLKWVFDKIL